MDQYLHILSAYTFHTHAVLVDYGQTLQGRGFPRTQVYVGQRTTGTGVTNSINLRQVTYQQNPRDHNPYHTTYGSGPVPHQQLQHPRPLRHVRSSLIHPYSYPINTMVGIQVNYNDSQSSHIRQPPDRPLQSDQPTSLRSLHNPPTQSSLPTQPTQPSLPIRQRRHDLDRQHRRSSLPGQPGQPNQPNQLGQSRKRSRPRKSHLVQNQTQSSSPELAPPKVEASPSEIHAAPLLKTESTSPEVRKVSPEPQQALPTTQTVPPEAELASPAAQAIPPEIHTAPLELQQAASETQPLPSDAHYEQSESETPPEIQGDITDLDPVRWDEWIEF